MKNTWTLLVLALCGATFGQEWDGFKVTWDINPFNPYRFADVPRTRAEAVADGWELVSSCSDGGQFQGDRYVKYEDRIEGLDYALMPIYDVNGYIAGVQGAIPSDLPDFPSSNIIPPFVLDTSLNMYTLTAYFVDPDIICSTGRSEQDFLEQGTGDRLVLQNGEELLNIPMTEEEALVSPWSLGQCFATMGLHFWYDVSPDMTCDEFQPMFLLYNRGRLNSFGWAYIADFSSPRYEKPPAAALGGFLPDDYPDCLNHVETFSTMHIYMTDSPASNFC